MEESKNNYSNRFSWVSEPEVRLKSQFSVYKALGSREQLEWIKHQLEYATFSERYKLRYDLKKGEIYEIDWGLNVNAEFSSRHYGVVMFDSGPSNPLVTVCPLKTNKYGAHPRSDIDLGFIPELNTDHSTLAIVNQVRSIDKLRIYTRNAIGFLNHHTESEKPKEILLNPDKHGFIPRLNDEKMNLIVDSYISLIQIGDLKYNL